MVCRISLSIALFAVTLGFSNSGEARSLRVCVVDQAVILQKSKLAAAEAAHFQQVRLQAQGNFDSESRMLDADVRALENLRASLPAAAIKQRTDDIARRRVQLKARGDQVNSNLTQLDAQLTASVARAAAPFISQVESKQGCSLLIARETLLNLSDPSLDITPLVITLMNAQ
jgi:Skp family chaperone for outer membrane proteins